ncbi:MAG: HEPN domain-containing protein [Acetobacteraceae bacterium]
MKPESADYLAKARECLDAAKAINALPLPQVAAKEAYLAAYHAAHAFVFESTGKAMKSHSGMRTMFASVTKDDPRVDRTLASLLARAYKFKEVADYGVGSQAPITAEEAQDVIDIAQRFVDTITQLLPPGVSSPRGPNVQP